MDVGFCFLVELESVNLKVWVVVVMWYGFGCFGMVERGGGVVVACSESTIVTCKRATKFSFMAVFFAVAKFFRLQLQKKTNRQPLIRKKSAWLHVTIALLLASNYHFPPLSTMPKQTDPSHPPHALPLSHILPAFCTSHTHVTQKQKQKQNHHNHHLHPLTALVNAAAAAALAAEKAAAAAANAAEALTIAADAIADHVSAVATKADDDYAAGLISMDTLQAIKDNTISSLAFYEDTDVAADVAFDLAIAASAAAGTAVGTQACINAGAIAMPLACDQ